ncbi:MAG: hypothetical protein WDM78_07100 [Puia sp.]
MQNSVKLSCPPAALGVTITVAAGDNGSSDRETDGKAHVDFPASSPYAVACGGTRLLSDSETVWNDQDGWATAEVSAIFSRFRIIRKISVYPASVNGSKKKGRGVPDIAANADSASGYNVLVDGQWTVVGGYQRSGATDCRTDCVGKPKIKTKSWIYSPQTICILFTGIQRHN